MQRSSPQITAVKATRDAGFVRGLVSEWPGLVGDCVHYDEPCRWPSASGRTISHVDSSALIALTSGRIGLLSQSTGTTSLSDARSGEVSSASVDEQAYFGLDYSEFGMRIRDNHESDL